MGVCENVSSVSSFLLLFAFVPSSRLPILSPMLSFIFVCAVFLIGKLPPLSPLPLYNLRRITVGPTMLYNAYKALEGITPCLSLEVCFHWALEGFPNLPHVSCPPFPERLSSFCPLCNSYKIMALSDSGIKRVFLCS